MSLGGGGGGQTVTQEFKPPSYTQADWQAYLNGARALSQKPYEQSGLPQFAPWNDYQDMASRLMYDKVTFGTPQSNAANAAAYNIASGNMANPWAGNLFGLASGQDQNAATEQMIANNAENMATAYANGTAAQNDMNAAMSGAFGGSAHELQQQAGAANLAKQVGQMATQTRQSQHQNDIQNMLAANQLGGGMYQNDIGNMIAAGGLGLQGARDYNADLQGLMGAGNSMNNYVQQLINQYNNQWNTENGYDLAQNDLYGNALSRASGSYYSSSQNQPGMSNLAGLLGLGAGAAGLYSLFR